MPLFETHHEQLAFAKTVLAAPNPLFAFLPNGFINFDFLNTNLNDSGPSQLWFFVPLPESPEGHFTLQLHHDLLNSVPEWSQNFLLESRDAILRAYGAPQTDTDRKYGRVDWVPSSPTAHVPINILNFAVDRLVDAHRHVLRQMILEPEDHLYDQDGYLSKHRMKELLNILHWHTEGDTPGDGLIHYACPVALVVNHFIAVKEGANGISARGFEDWLFSQDTVQYQPSHGAETQPGPNQAQMVEIRRLYGELETAYFDNARRQRDEATKKRTPEVAESSERELNLPDALSWADQAGYNEHIQNHGHLVRYIPIAEAQSQSNSPKQLPPSRPPVPLFNDPPRQVQSPTQIAPTAPMY